MPLVSGPFEENWRQKFFDMMQAEAPKRAADRKPHERSVLDGNPSCHPFELTIADDVWGQLAFNLPRGGKAE